MKYHYKSCFLVIALLAITAFAQAEKRQQIALQEQEIAEILAAQETYAYFGPAMCSLVADLPALTKMARVSGVDAKHLDALCELAAQGYTTAPATMVKAALDEAAACVAACKAELAAEELARIADALEAYDHALQSGAADLIIADDVDAEDMATRGTKKFYNIIVHNQASIGSLFVGGDEIVNHNLTVNNDLLVKGNEIINGTLTVRGATIFSGTSITIAGNEIISGNLIVNGNTTLGTCAAGSVNNINGITNINTVGTCATTIGNATNTTTITTTTAVVNGTLKVVGGDILLGNANAAGTVGVLKLGVDPIYEFNMGTSNFFAGDYTSGMPSTITTGSHNIAIGTRANIGLTTETNSISIGTNAQATGGTSPIGLSCNIAIGQGAQSAADFGAIAIGLTANASNRATTALGYSANASGFASTSLGEASSASGAFSSALGTGANSSGLSSLALSLNTMAVGTNGLAISNGATALSDNSIAIGTSATSTGNSASIAIGLSSHAFNASAIAIGNSAIASGSNSNAIGFTASTSAAASGGNAIGFGAGADGLNNVALGTTATATGGGSNAIAIGTGAMIGLGAHGNDAIAIGRGTKANFANSIAIGQGMIATTTGTFIAGIFGANTAGGAGVFVDSTGHLGTTSSSKRFKENFRNLDAHSAQIYNLNPVKFDYKASSGGAKDQFGLIAEEVAQHLPEIVVHDKDGEIYSVQYHILPTLLLNEMKHLAARIACLEAALQKTR